jgi:hypothetical protein
MKQQLSLGRRALAELASSKDAQIRRRKEIVQDVLFIALNIVFFPLPNGKTPLSILGSLVASLRSGEFFGM